ncbi:hypothetical protein B0J17DRAFT_721656 [Rhizoctonia solani]|nr:hypothetical protein B0J17DRAFT_721656 [Rhizoctonia solani]
MRIVLDYEEADDDSSEQSIPPEFVDMVTREAVHGYFDYLRTVAKSMKTAYRLQKMEYSPSLGYRMLSCGVCCYYCCAVVVRGPKALLEGSYRVPTYERIMAQTFRREFRAMLSLTRLQTLSLMDKDTQRHYSSNLFSGEGEQSGWISASYRAIQSSVCDSPSKKLAALKFLHSISSDVWGLSLRKCIARELSKSLHALIGDYKSDSQSRILGMVMANENAKQISASHFHDLIKERICTHAKSVGSKGLAAEQLVEIGIDIAMAEGWKQLPEGYGGRYERVNAEGLALDCGDWPFPDSD